MSFIRTCEIRARLYTGHPRERAQSAVASTCAISRKLAELVLSLLVLDIDVRWPKSESAVLTLETKLKIIQALENGNSQRVVGVKLGVSKSTVADIWKDIRLYRCQ